MSINLLRGIFRNCTQQVAVLSRSAPFVVKTRAMSGMPNSGPERKTDEVFQRNLKQIDESLTLRTQGAFRAV